jgi:NADPH oxidase
LNTICPTQLFLHSQFTITSAPEDDYISIHFRQVGDFTCALGDRVGAGPSVVSSLSQAAIRSAEKDGKKSYAIRGDFFEVNGGNGERHLPAVRIDGPYGAPAEDVLKAELAILIGAGIG